MECVITGEVAQTARVSLDAGEGLWASKGAIISHSPGVQWDVRIPGGLGAAFKRSLSGEGISLTRVESREPGQDVRLGCNTAGHIAEWDLRADGPVLTTRGAFLAAWGTDIDISVSVARRAGAALFGGAGLLLQRIQGVGTVLVQGRGDFERIVLAAGEERYVSTGNLAAFSDRLDYDIRGVGSLKKTLFGAEGLFMTRMTGPGTLLLQTLKASARRTPSS